MKNTVVIPALLIVLFAGFAQNLSAQTPSFQDFLAQFPKAELPYAFKAEDLQATLENGATAKARNNRLGWEYYQFLPELERSAQYSNMPVYPEPVAVFETENNYAVLYNIARGVSKTNKTFSVTVFDKNGLHIATNFVAGVKLENLSTASINEQLQATVNAYKVEWALNVKENGREGNKITGLTLKNTAAIDLTAPGNPDQLDWTSLNVLPIADTAIATAK
jgi:DNA-binding helix-hairpin-helix protein with protein kinase domain